ncbi:MAG: hypothetical protein JXB14_02120, partial [Candidatus Altiarchaeota archaeon]|nr:hypothetical protein [Candidatus Altiarchaeota archaeon]
MKKIICLWILTSLALLGCAQAQGFSLEGKITDVRITERVSGSVVEIYPSGSKEVVPGGTYYLDITVTNTGDASITDKTVTASVILPAITDHSATTLYPTFGTTSGNDGVKKLEKGMSHTFANLDLLIDSRAPDEPAEIVIKFDCPGSSGPLDTKNIQLDIVRTEPHYSLWLNNYPGKVYRVPDTGRIYSTPIDYDPYEVFEVKNLGNTQADVTLTLTTPRIYKGGSIIPGESGDWWFADSMGQDTSFSLGPDSSTQKRFYLSKDVVNANPESGTMFSNTVAISADSGAFTNLHFVTATFSIYRGSPPLTKAVYIEALYTDKKVYLPGDTVKFVCNFEVPDAHPAITEDSYMKFSFDQGLDGEVTIPSYDPKLGYVPVTVDDFVDIPIGAMGAGEKKTATGSFTLPDPLPSGKAYILPWALYANAYDEGSIIFTWGETPLNQQVVNVDAICLHDVPVKDPGSGLWYRDCGAIQEYAFIKDPRLYFYHDLTKIPDPNDGSTCPKEYNNNRMIKGGEKGIYIQTYAPLVSPTDPCWYRIYYTKAVASMTPDPTPSVLLLFLAAALAAFVEARLRRMRLEK